ncbi:hypothetical protein N9L47_11305 [Rhodobacteraceae bacterium]|nr:hypothetical protein [Paracoccaceae bacterium]
MKIVRFAFLYTKMQVTLGFIAALFATPIFADQTSLISAFEAANIPPENAEYKIAFEIDGCVFQQIIVNPNYCEQTGRGEGDRIITTIIDLKEVQAVRASQSKQGKFHINFELDFGGPGTSFILIDRALNGAEGAFQRFSKRSAAALEQADLQSGKVFSSCDGTPPNRQKSVSVALVNNVEPKGWRRLIELAKECRAPNPVELKER